MHLEINCRLNIAVLIRNENRSNLERDTPLACHKHQVNNSFEKSQPSEHASIEFLLKYIVIFLLSLMVRHKKALGALKICTCTTLKNVITPQIFMVG